MVASQFFPQEITDDIIDYLSDDRDTLKACALTCRAWLHRSRHHLHYSVNIDDAIYNVRRSSDYYSTPAAKYIRKLKLVSPPQSFSGNEDRDNTWKIVPRFTEITSLTLLYSYWAGKNLRFLEPITRNVKHLELVVASFGNCDEFFAFVAMFPELRSLVLSSLTIGSAFGRQSIRIDPPAKLSSLQYKVHFQQPAITQRIADWLAYLPGTTIPHFSLTWQAQSQSVPAVLKALGSRLTHVEIPVSHDCEGALEGTFNSKLQSIDFAVSNDFTTDKITAMTSMLNDIISSDIQQVAFRCHQTNLIELDVAALQPIDEILSGPQFEDISLVDFTFTSASCWGEPVDSDAFADRLRRTLRRLESRGALAINFA